MNKCINCNSDTNSDKATFCSDKCRKAYSRRQQVGDTPDKKEVGQTPRTNSDMTDVDKMFEEAKPGYYRFGELTKQTCHLVDFDKRFCSKAFESHLPLLKFCSPNHQKAAVHILGGNAEQAAKLI